MDDDKFLAILDRKTQKINELLGASYESPEFKLWHNTVKELLAKSYGEKSRQYEDFESNTHVLMVWRETYPHEEKEAYVKGLEYDRAQLLALKESVEDYGLPKRAVSSPWAPKEQPRLTQNFYLTQSQVQSVEIAIDLSSLDGEVRQNVAALLDELKKKDGKNTKKITTIIKWLADNAVDVLIALIAAKA